MKNKFESEKYGGQASKPMGSSLPAGTDLETRLQEAESELAGYRSVEDIAQFELKALRNKLAKMEAGVSSEEIDALRAQLAEKDREIERLLAAQANSQPAESSPLRESQTSYFVTQLEAARATIETLEQELLKASDVDLAAFDALKDDAEQLRTNVEELCAKLASREETIGELRRENGSLDQRLMDALTELTGMRAMRSEREAELQDLKVEIVQLKSDVMMVDELKAQLAQARFEVEAYSELKRAKEDAQHRASQLEGELSEAKQHVQDFDALKQRVAEAESAIFEIAQLKSNLKRHRSALADALDQIDSLVGAQTEQVEFATDAKKAG